jgi:hypothetical protein
MVKVLLHTLLDLSQLTALPTLLGVFRLVTASRRFLFGTLIIGAYASQQTSTTKEVVSKLTFLNITLSRRLALGLFFEFRSRFRWRTLGAFEGLDACVRVRARRFATIACCLGRVTLFLVGWFFSLGFGWSA